MTSLAQHASGATVLGMTTNTGGCTHRGRGLDKEERSVSVCSHNFVLRLRFLFCELPLGSCGQCTVDPSLYSSPMTTACLEHALSCKGVCWWCRGFSRDRGSSCRLWYLSLGKMRRKCLEFHWRAMMSWSKAVRVMRNS